jgi:hypothetical protein
LKRWLTKVERQTLNPDEKMALRRQRREAFQAQRPPWLRVATQKLGDLTLDALELLRDFAFDAVEAMAAAAIAKGRHKHDAAVRRVITNAGLHGLGAAVTTEIASELVWRAYLEFQETDDE